MQAVSGDLTSYRMEDLVARARAVAAHAWCPASGFAVGAAVLASDGSVHVGCNVENASYGLTVCAERNAVGAMVAAGQHHIAAVAVFTATEAPSTPCGACRQVLAEFGPAATVALGSRGETRVTTLDALFPEPFRFERPQGQEP